MDHHHERTIEDDTGLTDGLKGTVDDGKRYGKSRRKAAEFVTRQETVNDPTHPHAGERVERSYIHDRRADRNVERVVTHDGDVVFEKDVPLHEKNK